MRSENLLLAALVAMLALAPFPYGSNRTWAELGLGLDLGAILLARSGLALTGFAAANLPIRRLLVPTLCIAVALGWAVVQSIDLSAVARLTGVDIRALAHPLWALTSAALRSDAGSYI
jgi:hypothetical protein